MKRKPTAYRIVQAFILVLIVMMLPVTIWAQGTTLITVVPSSHILHIELTGEGTIYIDEVAYTKSADIEIQRLSSPKIAVQAPNGHEVKTVLWCGEDITESIQNGSWTAPKIAEDVVLTVTFERMSSTPLLGDADGDGYVDAYDASLIKKYSVGAISDTELNLSVCDLDGDGYVDAYDAALVQKYSVGAISSTELTSVSARWMATAMWMPVAVLN